MTDFERWDIVTALFPFTEAPIRKPRPVLILSNGTFNRGHGHLIGCMITTGAAAARVGDPKAGCQAAEESLQVFDLPGQVIRNAGAASRLLAAKTPDIAAAGRRDAVARWRRAMARGLSAAAAAERSGQPRATLYRWEKRPELRSRRPRRCAGGAGRRRWSRRWRACAPTTRSGASASSGRSCGAEGHAVSDATVGRILAHLVPLGRAVPAPAFRRPTRAAAQGRRRWARRLRGALKAARPGEAVQVDTLSLSFPGGKGVKQFTAVDRLSRWTVAIASARATAASAARFLDKLVAELPFELTAIQIDGRSEFMAEFEAACDAKGIALHVLPPRSPELNGRVERLQGTWRYEFYAVYDPPRQIDRLNPLIDTFSHRYNTYRPHTPLPDHPSTYLYSLQLQTPSLILEAGAAGPAITTSPTCTPPAFPMHPWRWKLFTLPARLLGRKIGAIADVDRAGVAAGLARHHVLK